MVARFEAERQALACMDHPSIAQVFEAGAHGGGPSVLRHGVAAASRSRRTATGTSSPSRAAGAVHRGLRRRAARPSEGHHPPRPQAVEHAGDVQDDAPVPKIIDFGVAKATSAAADGADAATRSSARRRHARVHEPRAGGEDRADVDTRTDVYALGWCSTNCWPAGSRSNRQCFGRRASTEIRRDDPRGGAAAAERTRGWRSPSAGAAVDGRGHGAGARSAAQRGDLDWITMKALDEGSRSAVPDGQRLCARRPAPPVGRARPGSAIEHIVPAGKVRRGAIASVWRSGPAWRAWSWRSRW